MCMLVGQHLIFVTTKSNTPVTLLITSMSRIISQNELVMLTGCDLYVSTVFQRCAKYINT